MSLSFARVRRVFMSYGVRNVTVLCCGVLCCVVLFWAAIHLDHRGLLQFILTLIHEYVHVHMHTSP